MGRIFELVAIVLPSIGVGWLWAYIKMSKKLDMADHELRVAMLDAEVARRRIETMARLVGVDDAELVRMVGDTGKVGIVTKPNK